MEDNIWKTCDYFGRLGYILILSFNPSHLYFDVIYYLVLEDFDEYSDKMYTGIGRLEA